MEPLTFEALALLMEKAIQNFALDDFLDISDESSQRLAISLVKTLAMAGALEEGSNILRDLKDRPIAYLDLDDEDEEFCLSEDFLSDQDVGEYFLAP